MTRLDASVWPLMSFAAVQESAVSQVRPRTSWSAPAGAASV